MTPAISNPVVRTLLAGTIRSRQAPLRISACRHPSGRRAAAAPALSSTNRAHFSSSPSTAGGEWDLRWPIPWRNTRDLAAASAARGSSAVASPYAALRALHPMGSRLLSGGPTTRSSTSSAANSGLRPGSPDDHDDGENDGKTGNGARQKKGGRYKAAKIRAREGAAKGRAAAKKGAVSVGTMVQKYGLTFFFAYFGLYFITLGSLFAGIDSGLLDPASVMSAVEWIPGMPGGEGEAEAPKSIAEVIARYMTRYHWSRPYAESVMNNPHFANFGVAWLAAKLTEPVRLAIAVPLTPKIHKALGRDEVGN